MVYTPHPTPHCVINVKLKRGVGSEHRKRGPEQDPSRTREDPTIGEPQRWKRRF